MNDRLIYRRRPEGAVRTFSSKRRLRRHWLGWIAVGAAALAGGAALRPARVSPPLVGEVASEALDLALPDLAVVAVGKLDNRVRLTGTLQPLDQSKVKSQVTGEIRSVTVRIGDTVKRDQVLARFDATEFQARLDEKQANVVAGRAQLELAARKRDQNRALFEKELVSKSELDTVESAYNVSLANVGSLSAQVKQARKALESTVVVAPLDGVVAERLAQPGLAVAPSTELFTIENLSTMELGALVPAGDISSVHVGEEARFRVEGFGEREFTGRVERISPSTQPGSRSIAVYLRIANPQGELRGGMFAEGTVLVEQSESVLLMPAAALHREGADTVAYRVESGVLERRPVQVGARDRLGNQVEVVSGLAAGARVVVGAIPNLRPGLPVRIADFAPAPAEH